MNTLTLTFHAEPFHETIEVEGDAQPFEDHYMDVSVLAAIDGKPINVLGDIPVFDFVQGVMSTDPALAGKFEFLTCSCGDAGCAGIWDNFHVHHENNEVVWRAPASAYFKHFKACGLAEGDERDLTFRFDVNAYRAAFEALTQELQALENAQELPLQLKGYIGETVPLADLVERSRHWRRYIQSLPKEVGDED